MWRRIVRIECHGLLEATVGPRKGRVRVPEHVMPPLEHGLIRRQWGRVPGLRWPEGQRDLQRPGNRLRDVVLNGKDVRQLALVPFGPQVTAVSGSNQLRRHTNAVARLAHAAFEYVRDAKRLRDA